MRTQTLKRPETELFIVEAGDPGNPPIVFLHGFPDSHELWRPHMESLSRDFHVISFDMRGCGKSTAPPKPQGYRIPRLMDDIDQVITQTCGPRGTVHLVGHDWGSMIGWSFVSDPAYSRRVRSWTSMAGPHLGVATQWALNNLKPSAPQRNEAVGQVLHSWYMLALNIPGAGRAAFSLAGTPIYKVALPLGGVPRDHPYLRRSRREIAKLTRHSFRLYQQNVLTPPEAPEKDGIRVPTQLVILEKDFYLRPAVCEAMTPYCRNLQRVRLAANHWAPISHPQLITDTIRAFVSPFEQHSGAA